ncbi:MAG TPA: hypothetical protein VIT23_08150 [Terrimicrobiaceae bacterium]
MRISLVWAAFFLLAGFPAEKTLSSPSPTPTEENPDPAPQPTPAKLVPDLPSPRISYEGTWTTTDAQGQVFDIILYPNGQAVTNWTKGPAGARGERGYWRCEKERLTIVYNDGCTDIIEPAETHSFRHRRYSAVAVLGSQPIFETEAKRTRGDRLGLVGVWRLNKEPDGSHLYIALQSNGSAVSTINGTTLGRWKANEKGALCEWPDGWTDQIELGNGGWQKRSWIGAEENAPADLSLATRVGETSFAIEP